MNRDLLLGVDVGTSSVKAGLFALDGRAVAFSRAPCPAAQSPRPGWAETPPERWWDALRRCLSGLGPAIGRTAGASFGALFPALVAMDERGEALRPAILYCDQRAARVVARMGQRAEEVRALTGNRVIPGTCSMSSLLWLREHEPGIFSKTAVFGHANTWLAHRLTGAWSMDPTNASLSGLVAIGDETRYSPVLCEIAGVSPERLPPIRESASVVGCVTEEAAGETGLPAGTPVAAGAGDTVAAALGAGLVDGDTAFCILGSSDNVVTVSKEPKPDPQACNMAHCAPGRWVSVRTATSTGAAVDWFAGAVLGRSGDAAAVEQAAMKSPPGANGVVFLPYLQGERTPVWDPAARGVFLGLTVATTREDMARAAIEGIAFAFRDLLGTRPPSRLVAVGGGSAVSLAMKLRATVAGRTIHAMEFPEAGALGAAMLAGMGVGLYASAGDAVRATAGVRCASPVEPVTELSDLYGRLRRAYRDIHPRLKSLFAKLAPPGAM